MRIGFMGKGGSGKTTVSAAFSVWAANKSAREVLVFDGDVNAHIKETLGIEGQVVPIGHHGQEIAEYVRGERRDLGKAPLLSTTPPGPGSKFLKATADDRLLSRFALRKDNLSLITVGSFKESDVGANCYHTKLHSLCMILNHLLDEPKDLVVTDCTAGTDSLSTSLLLAYDINIFVLEPTLKSVQVYLDYIATDPKSAYKTYALANKVASDQDLKFILSHMPKDKLIGSLPLSGALKTFEQGDAESFNLFVAESSETFKALCNKLQATTRNWTEYLSRLREVHEKNCKWWYNDFYGLEIHEQYDKCFSLEAANG